MQAEVKRLELSETALQALSPLQRYVFALVGHVFNELILLQKWAHSSRRSPGNPGPQEDAGVAITMFLIRLLSAKVYEALHDDALGKKCVAEVLRADYFGKVDGLNDKWDAVLKQYEALEWLGWIRNKGGFHYMKANQWEPYLDDTICSGAYVYVGNRYGDTYYHWADMAAALPAMSHVNPEVPMKGLEQMLGDLGQLLGDVTECLARGLQAFLNESGIGDSLSDPIRFDAPPIDASSLHYFFADEHIGGGG
ncbi:hypothetical protein WJ01_27115 [Burkholderia vietnamiensis]|uniref:hypothetical protein n=1 Tax=Burkholderia vietnamiensis TaxID=60552 RepID=UPI000756C127|nr:hypothetical protein [Burkholderia vietnamiensis]KVE91461.1 hypothetical protein WJ01_27115 [Burkholderia vietnamiensis]